MTYLWAKPKESEKARKERERLVKEFKAANPDRDFTIPMGVGYEPLDAANFSRLSAKGKSGAKSRWQAAHRNICFSGRR